MTSSLAASMNPGGGWATLALALLATPEPGVGFPHDHALRMVAQIFVAYLLAGTVGIAALSRRPAAGALALLVSQIYLLIVWGGLLFAAVLLLRLRGWEFDPFLDRVLSLFHDS